MKEEKKIAKWLIEGETGLSSKSMASVALGYEGKELNYPHDPSDFRRCYLFLMECIKDHKALLDKMALLSEKWASIRDNWLELLDLYTEEHGQKTAPKLYKKMKELGL